MNAVRSTLVAVAAATASSAGLERGQPPTIGFVAKVAPNLAADPGGVPWGRADHASQARVGGSHRAA
jgi:hypothetical protein